MALSKIQSGLITDDAVNSDAIADSSIDHSKMASGAKIGYIQSKHTGVNATNDMTGDYDHTDVTYTGGTGLIVDMGTPNSATSAFILSGDAQAYPDGSNQIAVDSGAYFGIGFMRKIGTGSWTAIRDQGRWGQGNGVDNDQNNRVELFCRDYPNTTEQVQYKLVFSTHRGGCYWGRQPTGQEGGNTNLYVQEFDTGETS